MLSDTRKMLAGEALGFMQKSEYDITRAFKRIENDLMDSMMRNLKRHQVEEKELGITWEQWQTLQLKELERYRRTNAELFDEDFKQINRKIDAMFKATCDKAQSEEEARLLDDIRKGRFEPNYNRTGEYFNLNDKKLNNLIVATRADFTKGEYAMLRRANDIYRQVIFDAMTYANITNDYKKAVDMATHDFLLKGINCIQYKNGARHTMQDYASMAIRTGNKRAYLMGEGNAHDKLGLHVVRVNKRTHACPLCVRFLGKLLIDDVYGGGTDKEASELGIPTLSQAMDEGFLHPNCKDMYSVYIEGVSQPAKGWTRQEIEEIVGEYNQEQQVKHAEDMAESYGRLSRYALDEENQQRYQSRADYWQSRADELSGMPAEPVPMPEIVDDVVDNIIDAFTDDEREAIEWYVSGDGMWINQYLRGKGDFGELSDNEQALLDLLKSATDRPLDSDITTLYRSVDASAVFGDMTEIEREHLRDMLVWGDQSPDATARIKNAMGKTIEEKGFMSTTTDKEVAMYFGDFTGSETPIVLELDASKAKLRGADLRPFDYAEDPQKEVLLHNNTKYKITDIGVGEYPEGGKYIKVKAELLDNMADADSGIKFADTATDRQRELISQLNDEYNSRLIEVKRGAEKASGDADQISGIIRLSSTHDDTTIHEFAHLIAGTRTDKLGLTDNAEFWKEIKKIRRQYMKDVADDPARWISSYEHASGKVDEFFAEAFTHAKMRELGLQDIRRGSDYTYSQQVLDVTNKYFGKKASR